MISDPLPPLRVSVVVPVYRSEAILEELCRQVQQAMGDVGWGQQFELILVNDCSPDGSWQVIRSLAQRHPWVQGLSLRKNFGQHNALMAGLHRARGRVVVLMDDDLQHPPADIIRLVRALEDNPAADVCYTRYLKRQHAHWKKLGSRFNDLVAQLLLKKPKGLYLSSFKAMRQDVAQEITRYDGPFPYVDGLILSITRAFTVVDIQHQARHVGEGNYGLRRSVSLWLKMATTFSVFPLRVATVLGFTLTLLSLAMMALVVYERLVHPELPPGWASLAAIVLLLGGIQTFCIGILGEYLGRAYLKLNRMPQFSVREATATAGASSISSAPESHA